MKTTQLIITCLISTTVCALAEYPLGFFANMSGTYLPISGKYHQVYGVRRTPLTYETNSRHAAEFVLKNNQAYTNDTYTPGPVGIYDGKVVVGPKVRPITFEFGDDTMVKNMTLWLCLWVKTKRYFLQYGSFPHLKEFCVHGQVYILPFDRSTGNVVENVPSAKDTSVVEKTRNTE